jgi:RodZ C-terminal domain
VTSVSSAFASGPALRPSCLASDAGSGFVGPAAPAAFGPVLVGIISTYCATAAQGLGGALSAAAGPADVSTAAATRAGTITIRPISGWYRGHSRGRPHESAGDPRAIVPTVPETRLERIIFALGLVAIAGIAVLIAFAHASDSATSAPAAGSTTATRPAATSFSTPMRQKPATTRAQTRTRTHAQASSGVRLRLTASRADSWVEIRSGSAQGKVLFVGVMTEGEARSFRGSKLYARFGSAGSFDARLDGVALQLQPGTYSALVTSRGLEQVSAG